MRCHNAEPMNATLVRIFDAARPYLSTRSNEEHTRIAFDFAVRLLDQEEGNPNVVLPAVILHDVGWKSIPEDLQLAAFGPGKIDANLNRLHELEGARIARSILETERHPPHLIDEITEIILEHDSRPEPLSQNDAIVKDSDKLWRYSQRGLAVDVQRFGLNTSRYLSSLRKKIDEWFHTPTARRIATEELRLREKSPGVKD